MGGIAALVGMFDDSDADAAEYAANKQAEATAWQGEIARATWDRYLQSFAPLEDKIVRESQAPVEEQPGYGRMMATIERGYGDLEGNLRRTMGGRYISGAGLERQALRNTQLLKTRAKSGAVADAQANRFNRMIQAASLGRNLPATAGYTSSGTAQGYGQLANMYANAAQAGARNWGQVAGNLGQTVADNWDRWFPSGDTGGGGPTGGYYDYATPSAGSDYGANWYDYY